MRYPPHPRIRRFCLVIKVLFGNQTSLLKKPCRNITQFFLFEKIRWSMRIYILKHTNIRHRNNTEHLYLILGRADLHSKSSSWIRRCPWHSQISNSTHGWDPFLVLKTFKASLYSSQNHFIFDNVLLMNRRLALKVFKLDKHLWQ